MTLQVTAVERIPVKVPFREICRAWMEVEVGRLSYIDVFRVSTSDPQIVGYGESFTASGSRGVPAEAIARVMGANPAELALDDSLGQGLQMALLDIVGKQLGVPVWQLLGPELVRSECALSWWSSALTPLEQSGPEAEAALAAGYLTHKLKTRPWCNVFDQVEAIAAVTPPDYKLDLDWNGMLQTRGEAAAVLTVLDKHERVGIYESPIRLEDVEGMALLRRQVARPLAEHFRPGYYRQLLRADAVDGFIIFEGGASALLRQADVGYAFDKSSWFQVLGTGLTTAFTLHLGAVSRGARWPTVTCLNIYDDDLLTSPLQIRGGLASVPQGPGLGVAVDEDALERYRTDPSRKGATPRRLIVVHLAAGTDRVYPDAGALWRDARDLGWTVVQPVDARLEIRTDDGSTEFDDEYVRVRQR